MLPIIQFGPLSLPVPALLLLLGFWVGSILAEKAAARSDLDPSHVERLLWVGLGTGLIGARLSYLVLFPGAFRGDLFSILSLNPAFLDPASGLVVGIAAIIFIIIKENLDFRKLLDVFMIFVLTIFIFLSLSRFAGGSGLGSPTDMPWGIAAAGAIRHPVQLYYAILGLIGLVSVFLLPPAKNIHPGGLAAALSSFLSGLLLFLSRFQLPAPQSLGRFRADQILYWLLLLISLYFSNQLFNKPSMNSPEIKKKYSNSSHRSGDMDE